MLAASLGFVAPRFCTVRTQNAADVWAFHQLISGNLEELRETAVYPHNVLRDRQGHLSLRDGATIDDEVQTHRSGRFLPLLCHAGDIRQTDLRSQGNTDLRYSVLVAIVKASKHALKVEAPHGDDYQPGRAPQPKEPDAQTAGSTGRGNEGGSMRTRRVSMDRKTIGYVRVSTQEQAQAGFSLSAQRGRLEAFAQATNREPIDDFLVDDGFSGSSLDRPAMKELLARIERREIGAVLVTKLDRLSRNLRDILDLLDLCQRTDTALLSASESLDTSSAVGRMLVHLLGTFAEFERGRIGERTADVLEHKRRSGKVYCSHVPFGYRRANDELIPVHAEQTALTEMRRMHEAGKTYREIGEMLEARGIPPRGKRWYPASVRAVLQSKMTREAV